MSRPSFRRTMTLENLEKREVLSAPAPDGTTQYALQLLNMARTQPAQAAQWLQAHADANVTATLSYYNVDLQQELSEIASATPQPPLAYNAQLAAAAQAHSQDQASNNFQGHQGSDGSTINSRIQSSGYGNSISDGEDAFAYANSVDHAMEAFLLDWGVGDKGHRRNILQPGVSANDSFRDVGIGIVNTGNSPDSGSSQVGPNVVTIDFSNQQNQQSQLLGVVFSDQNSNNFYDPNEGVGGVLIQATNTATGQVSWTVSANAGGYQMPIAPGSYHVTAQVNGTVVGSQDVTVGSTNVAVNFNTSIPYSPPTPAPVQQPVQPVQQPVQPVQQPIQQPVQQPIQQPVQQPAQQPVQQSVQRQAPIQPMLVTTPAPAPIVVAQPPIRASNTLTANPLSWITSWSAFRNGVRIG